jgi:drug/metabolite transporter (DMT)-like permease
MKFVGGHGNKLVTSRCLPYFLLAIAPLCWAGNIVLARGVTDIVGPVSLAFWRWATAFMILLPFAWRNTKKDWRIVVAHWKILLFLSICGITCFNTLLYTAVHTTTAINGALIQTMMPAFIILISLVFFSEKITQLQILGVALCMLGAVLVVLQGKLTTLMAFSFVKGDILMIVAVILYALYSAFLRKRPPIHPLSFLITTFGIGTMGLLPVYFWELNYGNTHALTQEAVISIIYVAVFPSIVAYLCWNKGIEIIGANRAGLFINLTPVFASIMAIIFLDETLKLFHVLGMILIFGGMILFNR